MTRNATRSTRVPWTLAAGSAATAVGAQECLEQGNYALVSTRATVVDYEPPAPGFILVETAPVLLYLPVWMDEDTQVYHLLLVCDFAALAPDTVKLQVRVNGGITYDGPTASVGTPTASGDVAIPAPGSVGPGQFTLWEVIALRSGLAPFAISVRGIRIQAATLDPADIPALGE